MFIFNWKTNNKKSICKKAYYLFNWICSLNYFIKQFVSVDGLSFYSKALIAFQLITLFALLAMWMSTRYTCYWFFHYPRAIITHYIGLQLAELSLNIFFWYSKILKFSLRIGQPIFQLHISFFLPLLLLSLQLLSLS